MKIGSKFRVSALIVLLSVLAELSYSTGGYYASLLPIGFGIVLYFVIKELSDMNVSRNIITLRAEVQNNVYVTHVNEDTEVKEERFMSEASMSPIPNTSLAISVNFAAVTLIFIFPPCNR